MPPHSISTELKNLLDDAVAWYVFNTYPMDERAVRLHHRLTFIHPFPNGNGRCSRVFADLYLEQRGAYLEALRTADMLDYGLLLKFVTH